MRSSLRALGRGNSRPTRRLRSLLPSALRALKIDPALAGGVVLTTITDVAGFFVFLGLATLAYA